MACLCIGRMSELVSDHCIDVIIRPNGCQCLKAELLMRLEHGDIRGVLQILPGLPFFNDEIKETSDGPFINIQLSLDKALKSWVSDWNKGPHAELLCLAAFVLFGLSFKGNDYSRRKFLLGLVSRLSSSPYSQNCDLFETCLCQSREDFAAQCHDLHSRGDFVYLAGYYDTERQAAF